jgi:hypothetical protein
MQAIAEVHLGEQGSCTKAIEVDIRKDRDQMT